MEDVRKDRMKEWLKLSELQYEILLAVYRLQKQGGKTNPATIRKHYFENSGETLKQPSLFVSLRELSKKGVVVKGAHSSYYLSAEGITRVLDTTRENLEAEIGEFDKARADLKNLLDAASMNVRPSITHYEISELIRLQTEHLREARNYIGMGNTCMLAWTKRMVDAYAKIIPSMREYVEVQKDMVLAKRSVDYRFLTRLDMAPIGRMLEKAYGKKSAHKEIESFFDNLSGLLKTHKNVSMGYAPYLGMPFLIPYKENPAEVFLIIRDSQGIYMAGMHIYAPEIAEELTADFNKMSGKSVNLRSRKGLEVLERQRKVCASL